MESPTTKIANWTKVEHRRFVKAVRKHGREVEKIAEVLGTKTAE